MTFRLTDSMHNSVMKSLCDPRNTPRNHSVNTVHHAIHKCRLKIYPEKKTQHVNMIKKHHYHLWAKVIWIKTKWKKLFCGHMN